MKRLAIVGIWYDGYYDLWIDFLRLFNKYWKDCPYNLYIVNIDKDIDMSLIGDVSKCKALKEMKIIHAGECAEYSKKVQMAVEQVDADYFLLLLEDFFIGEKIDNKRITNIMEYIYREGLKYYSMPMKEFQSIQNQIKFNRQKKLYRVSKTKEYTICCQPAIWKKSFLKECIGTTNYNAWVFEGIYCKSKKAHTDDFCNNLIIDNSNPLNLYHGALQGRIVRETYNHFKKIGYTFYNNLELISIATCYKNKVKRLLIKYVPLKIRTFVKSRLKNNSVIERFNEDIQREIKNTIGE